MEPQNTNPAACRFYAKHGFKLGSVWENAYAEYPDDIQLLWYLQAPRQAA